MTSVPTEAINELNFRRRVQHLHRLGPRATGELLAELAAISGRRTWLDQRLATYAAIDQHAAAAVGARDWPRPILHLAGGRGR